MHHHQQRKYFQIWTPELLQSNTANDWYPGTHQPKYIEIYPDISLKSLEIALIIHWFLITDHQNPSHHFGNKHQHISGKLNRSVSCLHAHQLQSIPDC